MSYSKKFIILSGLLLSLWGGAVFADYGIVDAVVDTWLSTTASTTMQFPAALSLSLVRRHMAIVSRITSDNAIAGPVDYIQTLENAITFDVIHELDFVQDKAMYLSGYMADISHTLNLVDGYTSSLQSIIDTKTDERNTCIDNKKQADAHFFASLKEFDQAGSDAALQESMDAGSCEEKARIVIVATTLQLRRIKQLHDILDKKYVLLDTNKDTIIAYFPLVKTQLLQQLLVLSSQLQNYTTILDE